MNQATTAKVVMTIQKGEALVALNPGGTSNPFVTITVGTQSASTPAMSKTTNPLYDSTFTFMSCQLPTIVTLRVFNKLPYVEVEDPMGTATITLFSASSRKEKVVALSHGGNASLAQRAANGCGNLYISYEVVEMAQELPAPAPVAEAATISSSSSDTRSVPAQAAIVPLIPPPAINISGPPALPTPIPIITGGSGDVYGSAMAVLPPTTKSPSLAPAPAPTAPLSATQRQHLTPPSLAPAREPALAGVLVPQVAVAPPPVGAPASLNTSTVPGVVSFPVPGARVSGSGPDPVLPLTLSLGQQQQWQVEDSPPVLQEPQERYYANNSLPTSANAQTRSSPAPGVALAPSVVPVPSLSSLTTMVAALPTVAVAPTYSLHDAAGLARSPAPLQNTTLASTPNSSLFTSAANAPALVPQSMVSSPPNIDGLSAPLPAPQQFPETGAPSQLIDPQPPRALMATAKSSGTIPVAAAPRSQPLSSSTSTSCTTTPSTTSAAARAHVRSHEAMPFPAAAVVATSTAPPPPTMTTSSSLQPSPAAPLVAARADACSRPLTSPPFTNFPPSAASAVTSLENRHYRGVTPVTALASSVAVKVPGGFPTKQKKKSASHGNGKHAQQSQPQPQQKDFAGVLDAAAIYADKQYLFECAASGEDIAIFRQLRVADPLLANGFMQCVDYAGRTLLHIACWHGQMEVIQILLSPAPEPPIIDLRALVAPRSGNTILHAAACGGQTLVAQWLRYTHPTAGPLLLGTRNHRGMTAAECAKEAGFDPVARLLIPA